MVQLDASSVVCLVFTEAEGALSGFGHDLALRVTRFSIDVDEASGRIEARFDAGSLVVEGVVENGRLLKDKPNDKDRADIQRTARRDVLDSQRFPEVRFAGGYQRHDDSVSFEGELTLHGRTRALSGRSKRDGDMQTIEVQLHQPDFGIAPYRALLGALKVRPKVRVTLAFPSARLDAANV